MKVLHVEAGMHLYGGALQVVFLLRGLKARGIHSVLACPTGSAIASEAAAHAEVVQMTMKGDADVGLLGRLRKLIREVQPDVVHLHSRRGSDIWARWRQGWRACLWCSAGAWTTPNRASWSSSSTGSTTRS